ncbi:acid phosphatase pho5 [Dipodascopsis tothii]|uniref:acid phosphatase pho5 n=1 Tax=Dipodascopsis tothii TaxID=44089 RepID=UPI0034CF01AB
MLLGSLTVALAAAGACAQAVGQFAQDDQTTFNVLHHLGGHGPYVRHRGYGIPWEPPAGCYVDQVHMLMRHGERYPKSAHGRAEIALIERLKRAPVPAAGPLAFVHNYTYFSTIADFGLETATGPYAGTKEAVRAGTAYGERYGHLVAGETAMFTADSNRVVVTAQKFAEGFFARPDWNESASLYVVSQAADRGADTLTPDKTCARYHRKANESLYTSFPDTYLHAAAARLNRQSPGFNVTAADAGVMMTLCGLELDARPSSPWCTLFTPEEWIAHGYTEDLAHFYKDGPGHELSRTLGLVWANATAALMGGDARPRGSGSDAAGPPQSVYLSFTHDKDVMYVVSALGLADTAPLPTDRIDFGSRFVSSEIVPMAARVVLERLHCGRSPETVHVRVVLNDAVVPVPGCQTGPGFACPLEDFRRHLAGRAQQPFDEACGLNASAARAPAFFARYRDAAYTRANVPIRAGVPVDDEPE